MLNDVDAGCFLSSKQTTSQSSTKFIHLFFPAQADYPDLILRKGITGIIRPEVFSPPKIKSDILNGHYIPLFTTTFL